MTFHLAKSAFCGQALYIADGWLFPGRKWVVPYSIQTLKRLKPELFRQDLIALFDLFQQKKFKPLIERRFPLTEAIQAQELLGMGGVTGKIVLVPNRSPLETEAAYNGMQRTTPRAAADAGRSATK